jgi:phosphoadenosine phosphosulfate reductase
MTRDEIDQMKRRLYGMSSEEMLVWAVSLFTPAKVAFATSLGAEDQVLTDLLSRLSRPPLIFTLDTGRLFQETYDTLEGTQQHYGVEIELLFPEHSEVETLVRANGPNLFYRSREKRKLCCRVRKVNSLTRRLRGFELWITGLRREQAITRETMAVLEWDDTFGLLKLNPLLEWSTAEVWSYIREHRVPYHPLHDQGYPSIGCAPCTRAVKDGEDLRAGRWWWEEPEHKECGLHWQEGKPVRAKLCR